MALSARQRWTVLGGALAVTLALVAWLDKDTEESTEPPAAAGKPAVKEDKPAGPSQSGKVGQIAALPPGQAAPPGQAGEIVDLFAPQSWHVAPAPQEAAAPSAPQIPQLPFTYFGKLIEGGRVTVYLATQDRNLAVRRGDVIDGIWRVESIGPTAMTFRYLPMGQKLSLEIGRTK